MSEIPRITGIFTIESAITFNVKNTTGPGVYRVCTLAAGSYYCSNDGTASDLINAVEAAIIAAAVSNDLDDVTVTMSNTTGIVTLGASDGDSYIIQWDTDGVLRDWLRFSGVSTNFSAASPAVGSRAHAAGFYPALAIIKSNHTWLPQNSQSRADDGSVQTISYPAFEEHSIEVWLTGWFHSAALDEWHDLKDWVIDHMANGERFRMYFDRTVTNAYAEASSNSYGYLTFVGKDISDFTTEQLIQDLVTYQVWSAELYLVS